MQEKADRAMLLLMLKFEYLCFYEEGVQYYGRLLSSLVLHDGYTC